MVGTPDSEPTRNTADTERKASRTVMRRMSGRTRWSLAIGAAVGIAWPLAEVVLDCTGSNFDRCGWGKQLLPFTLILGALVGLCAGGVVAFVVRHGRDERGR